MLKVAIVGSGIAGISAAWVLSQDKQVTIFEAGDYLGGHTNTQQIEATDGSGATVGVDTGFIVCNPNVYPNFLALMDELDVKLIKTDMNFAVSRQGGKFEWSGNNLDTVFAQKLNLLNPYMWQMLFDLRRFNKQATEIVTRADQIIFHNDGTYNSKTDSELMHQTVGSFFKEHGYSQFFYDNYILPMTASIWSTPADVVFEKFPILTLLRFMRNHSLLQIGNRPAWLTVDGGSNKYITKALKKVKDIRLNTRIVSVKRSVNAKEKGTVTLTDSKGNEHEFDHVIFACHSDQALAVLGDAATPEERKILGSIKFSKNRAVLHRDQALMPKIKKVWSAWNYMTTEKMETKSKSMCLTYYMNALQKFIDPTKFGHVFVTMNPLFEPQEKHMIAEFDYDHPVYTTECIAAQEQLNTIQNKLATSYCGAWTNYGFHEDGCTSGLLVAVSLGSKCPFEISYNGGFPTKRKAPRPPKYLLEQGVHQYVFKKSKHVDYLGCEKRNNGSSTKIMATLAALAIAVGLYLAKK
jgi:predicted NAD/FAD-binding protein